MLINASNLKGLTIRAIDGDLGTIDDLYFDDETWAIRYLTVETGGWLGGRQVLLSPISIVHADWQGQRLDVALTKQQIQDSPDIQTHEPVSRQQEAEFYGYYGYPYYWDGPYLWGPAYFPADLTMPVGAPAAEFANQAQKQSSDSHLRSARGITGYYLAASDGEIGHVSQFIVNDESWAIRYIEVATQNWWPGKKVLISPAWVERVSWADSKVYIAGSRETVKNCPEYNEAMPLTREYENKLYNYYGQPPYWLNEVDHESTFSLRGA